MGRLNTLWDQVHMDQRQRESRVERAYEHFYSLLDDIVGSEEAMVQGVLTDTEARRLAVAEYRRELQLGPFDESLYPQGSIAMLKAYDKEYKRLEEKRLEVLSRQTEVYNKLVAINIKLGNEAPIFADVSEKILPPSTQLNMASLCAESEKELKARLEEVGMLQAQAKLMIDRLGAHNVSTDEVALAQIDYSVGGTPVPMDVVEQLQHVCGKLKTDWDKWVDNARFRYEELYFKLEDLYEKCAVATEDRIHVTIFNPETHGEQLLQMMQNKAEILEARYHRAQNVFDKFSEWHNLWQEKVTLEDAPTDYKNRGGDLAKRLKRQNELKKKVPEVYQDLIDVVALYLEEHADVDEAEIHIGGRRPDQRAAYIKNQYEKDKEEARLAKQIQKENEHRFGSPARTPKTALNKIRQTPSSIKKKHAALRKRSISCSDLSVITPVNDTTVSSTPMTSSPKTPSGGSGRRMPMTPRTPLTPGKHRQFGTPLTPRTPKTPRSQHPPWK
ncbi:SPD-1 protein [Aphelenchoides avenae]|nr:SPD-1 protein [Aphelenchus avenae]